MIEETFAIIKPDVIKNKKIGSIIKLIETAGFEIIWTKMIRFTIEMADEFYAIHRGKPFHQNNIEFMSSGPIILMILKRENAVETWRRLMGNTDPQKAEWATIRHHFGSVLPMNAVHGSDSVENAEKEITFFFSKGIV